MGASVADGTARTKALWQPKQNREGTKDGPRGWTGSKVKMKLEGAGARLWGH